MLASVDYTVHPSTMNTTQAGRILILDDHDANRTLLKIALNLNGIQSIEAERGESALKMWQPGAFRVALLDIELPDMSGLEVARLIREQDPYIQIIMCSTNDDPETIHRAIQIGCDVFLVKPLQLDLLFKLTQQMGGPRPEKVQVIDNQGHSRWESRPL